MSTELFHCQWPRSYFMKIQSVLLFGTHFRQFSSNVPNQCIFVIAKNKLNRRRWGHNIYSVISDLIQTGIKQRWNRKSWPLRHFGLHEKDVFEIYRGYFRALVGFKMLIWKIFSLHFSSKTIIVFLTVRHAYKVSLCRCVLNVRCLHVNS